MHEALRRCGIAYAITPVLIAPSLDLDHVSAFHVEVHGTLVRRVVEMLAICSPSHLFVDDWRPVSRSDHQRLTTKLRTHFLKEFRQLFSGVYLVLVFKPARLLKQGKLTDHNVCRDVRLEWAFRRQ